LLVADVEHIHDLKDALSLQSCLFCNGVWSEPSLYCVGNVQVSEVDWFQVWCELVDDLLDALYGEWFFWLLGEEVVRWRTVLAGDESLEVHGELFADDCISFPEMDGVEIIVVLWFLVVVDMYVRKFLDAASGLKEQA
jgi:hypothetical protein